MRNVTLTAVAALSLAACDGANSPAAHDALLVVKAQDAVRARLRDPGSATFDDTRVAQAMRLQTPDQAAFPGEYVCGTVNARNGFGGLSGPQRFVAGSVAAVLETDDPVMFSALWGEVCAR